MALPEQILKSKNLTIQRLAFVLKGKNRRTVYLLLLRGPRTISSISVVTGIYLSTENQKWEYTNA